MENARWEFVTGPVASGGLDAVTSTDATRKYVRRLNSADTATITADARAESAVVVDELAYDLWVYRDGVAVHRGRIGPTDDDIDSRQHKVTLTSWGYRQLLDYRYTEPADTLSFAPGTDVAAIAWSLINATQGRTGGSLGITKSTTGFDGSGVANTGVTAERNYVADKAIGTLIDQLGDAKGFDWDISPARQLRVWGTRRGGDNGYTLLWGGNVAQVKRAFNPSAFANAIAATGSASAPRSPASGALTTAGIATDPRGRWEARTAYGTVAQQATLDQHAAADLALRATPSYAWTVTMFPGRWGGFDALDVGDTASLAVKSGRLVVAADVRITEIAVTLPVTGEEQVTIKAEQLS